MIDQHPDSPAPSWWTAPGETDTFAYVGLVVFLLLVLLVIHLYARFDRHAEHRSAETPLRTTVPTMLTIALAFEVFPPLSHFSILLPLALIAAALARDFMLWSQASNTLGLATQAQPGAGEGPASEADPADAPRPASDDRGRNA